MRNVCASVDQAPRRKGSSSAAGRSSNALSAGKLIRSNVPEVGLLVTEADNVATMRATFEADWDTATAF